MNKKNYSLFLKILRSPLINDSLRVPMSVPGVNHTAICGQSNLSISQFLYFHIYSPLEIFTLTFFG